MIPKLSTLIIASRARVVATMILAVVAGWAGWHSLRPVGAALATTWSVSVGSTGACTISDPNCATISAAVAAAAAGDTINVAAGTYNEFDITINKSLTISGAGANNTIVDAQQMGRVFYAGSQSTVNISGLTIKNGLTGGLLTDAADRTSKNRITANAVGPRTIGLGGIDGGGIYNSAGTALNLTSCTVSDNATPAGGVLLPPAQARKASQRFAHIVRAASATQQLGGPGGSGGGIFNGGTLTMMDCTVTNNRTGFGADSAAAGGNGGDGGGIHNLGAISVTNSTIANNRTGRGGNIISIPLAPSGATATPLEGLTPGNGGEGGGISNRGSLNLRNSTIANNETGPAGVLINVNAAKPANGTVAPSVMVGPTGGNGGGVYSGGTQTQPLVVSTIIANNIVSEDASGPDIFTDSPVNSQGYNLVGIVDGSTGFTQPTDQKGTSLAPLNPVLGPLANNGGPTRTMALLANSPAIDKGINSGCMQTLAKTARSALACGLPFDQRGPGFSRTYDNPLVVNATQGDGTDIGAFEVQLDPCAPDLIPPVIVCPGSLSKFADSGQFSATVNPGTPVATDNCALQSIVGVRNDGKPLTAPYPVGVTLITWTATDVSGNKASCGQSIAVMIPSDERKRIPGVPD